VLTYPLMTAIQLISAQIGRVTGKGLAANLGTMLPGWLMTLLVVLLFIANTINLGADLAAMGAAAQLVVGWGDHWFTLAFALASLLLQLFIPYKKYASILKWLTLVLLAYVAVVFMVKLDWAGVALHLIWPDARLDKDMITTIVAILGTTISPYLFFWQSAQEVEEVEAKPQAHPLNDAPEQAPKEMARMKLDTFAGMAVSNIIALAIMISAGATLNAAGKTDIGTAAEAAEALRPAAGDFAFLLFSLGIIGTGLLAIPVLAGSAAYAIGESRGWKCGLDQKPWEAAGFYIVIAAATLLGVVIDWSGIDPIKALFWSAVVNGLVAFPIMVAMMVLARQRGRMGDFRAGWLLTTFGWIATLGMGIATLGFFTTLIS
jgi:Mn2+/Fe2+ NRAMP family transporter